MNHNWEHHMWNCQPSREKIQGNGSEMWRHLLVSGNYWRSTR
jgi:hypothetical protein